MALRGVKGPRAGEKVVMGGKEYKGHFSTSPSKDRGDAFVDMRSHLS